jgi:hypothetical protein
VFTVKGIESIVGAYLALILITGAVLGLFIWSKHSILYLKEDISTASARFQYILYPPILTLRYVNESVLLLTIYPRIPVYVREIILRDLGGNLLHYKYLDILVNNSYSVEIPIINTPFHILLVSNDGVIYYYNPRDDPGLATAPDYLRSKGYIDSELIEYLSSSNSNSTYNSELIPILSYGYKLHVGNINMDIYNQPGFKEFLYLVGPIDCGRVRFDAYGGPYWDMVCNCNMSSRFHWLTYGLYGKYTTNPYPPRPITGENFYFVQNGSLLIIGTDLTWSNNYFQVYRLLKYTGNTPIQFNVTIKVRGYYYLGSAQYPLTLDFIPVVYIYDATTSPLTPVSLGRGSSDTFKPWLKRIPLESSYISTNSLSFWSKTYTVTISPHEVGITSAVILVGLELLKVSSMTGYIEIYIQT